MSDNKSKIPPPLPHQGRIICNQFMHIIDANDAACTLSGYERTELVGRKPSIFKSGLHDKAFYERIWESIEDCGFWEGEIWNRTKHGEIYQGWLTIIRQEGGDGYYGTISKATQVSDTYGEIRSLFDPLTHVPTKVWLSNNLDGYIDQASRLGNKLAVCYLDICGLRTINKEFGYKAGNAVLLETVSRVKGHIKEGDVLARMLGSEFVILLTALRSLDDCLVIVQEILNTIVTPIEVEKGKRKEKVRCSVTANIGITLYPDDASNAFTLVKHADQVMYASKLHGNNCYTVYDHNQDRNSRLQREILNSVSKGIKKNEFCLFYQPKVEIESLRIVGFEALARWNHPEKGILPPIAFIPAIENTTVDLQFSKWALKEAIRQIDLWTKMGCKYSVSVNITAMHLLDKRFCDELGMLLYACEYCQPEQIELEIVESMAIADTELAVKVLDECRRMGVKIALDDFGTGYSSLAYLRTLPVDTIKIDQLFIRNMQENESDMAIVRSIIALAGTFRRHVIAEGVETHEQQDILKLLGCPIVQGYLYSVPVPPNRIQDWIDQTEHNEGQIFLPQGGVLSHAHPANQPSISRAA